MLVLFEKVLWFKVQVNCYGFLCYKIWVDDDNYFYVWVIWCNSR